MILIRITGVIIMIMFVIRSSSRLSSSIRRTKNNNDSNYQIPILIIRVCLRIRAIMFLLLLYDYVCDYVHDCYYVVISLLMNCLSVL